MHFPPLRQGGATEPRWLHPTDGKLWGAVLKFVYTRRAEEAEQPSQALMLKAGEKNMKICDFFWAKKVFFAKII